MSKEKKQYFEITEDGNIQMQKGVNLRILLSAIEKVCGTGINDFKIINSHHDEIIVVYEKFVIAKAKIKPARVVVK